VNEYGYACRVVEGKSIERRPLKRPRYRWKGDIKTGLKEIEWESVVWIRLIQDRKHGGRCVNTVLNFRVSLSAGNSLAG
jgi:hypothetical protein